MKFKEATSQLTMPALTVTIANLWEVEGSGIPSSADRSTVQVIKSGQAKRVRPKRAMRRLGRFIVWTHALWLKQHPGAECNEHRISEPGRDCDIAITGL